MVAALVVAAVAIAVAVAAGAGAGVGVGIGVRVGVGGGGVVASRFQLLSVIPWLLSVAFRQLPFEP